MHSATLALTVLAALTLLGGALVLLPLLRPALTRERGGKALAFIGFCVVPLLVTAGGSQVHLRQARSTGFCLSCHEMLPYGRSLGIESNEHLPALHWQNNWIDREQACFTCHTEYTMFGDSKAKLRGLRHLWVHYAGSPPAPGTLALYSPYSNRECLHCHDGARRYEALAEHAEVRAELLDGRLSCLECHDRGHDVKAAPGGEEER